MRVIRDRVARLDHGLLDVILATAVVVGLELQCLLGVGVADAHRAVTAVASLLFAAPIAVRRVWPGPALVFCALVAAIAKPFDSELLMGLSGDVVPVLVLSYSAGAWDTTRRGTVTAQLALAVLVAWSLLPGVGGAPVGSGAVAQGIFYVGALTVPAWIVGRLVRGHSRRGAAFRELAARAQIEREQRSSILETDPDLRVVAEADNGSEAVEAVRRARPDVVLMDIRMPVMDGLEATRRIIAAKAPPRVLMLTTFDLDEYVFDALVAGASGFLLKDVAPEQLLAGIRVIAAGDSLLSPSVTRRLIESFVRDHPRTPHPPPGLDELTTRELEIFGLIARGLSNAEIAEQLVVSSTTIKTHVARVLIKLGLRDRVQAVVLAYESGVLRPGAER